MLIQIITLATLLAILGTYRQDLIKKGNQENTAKFEKLFPKIVMGLAIAILVVWPAVDWFATAPKRTQEKAAQDAQMAKDEEMSVAKLTAKEYVKSMLKSPSAAKFSDVSVFLRDPAKKIYKVGGVVDGQNSFGATVRDTFGVIIQLHAGKDGGWEVLYCDISGNVVVDKGGY